MRPRRFRLDLTVAVVLVLLAAPSARAQRSGTLRDEALRLYESGDAQAALPQLDAVLNRRPRDFEARAKRGNLLLRLRRPADAVADFDAVIRHIPWSHSAYIDRGIARVMLGDYDAAKSDFDRALGLLALTFGRDRRAVASAHCGLGQLAHRSGQEQLAVDEYGKAIRADPTDPTGYLGRGESLASAKLLERAIADYDEAIRLDPRVSRAYTFRGDAFAQLGQNPRALADFDRALELDPNDERAHSFRGSLLAQMGENERALADLDAVIRLDPRRAAAYKDRGGVLVRLGRHDRAIEDLNEAIRLDPRRASSYQNRGAAYSGLGQYERAVDDLNEAVHIDPSSAGARTNLGLALFGLGQYERAIAELSEAVRLAPENSLVHLNRAGTYARLGLLERAVEDYNTAIRLDPNAILAHVGLGQAHDGLGRRVQAIREYDMALRLNPNNARVYCSRGNARRAEGDWAGAIDDFSRAIQLDPKHGEAYVFRGWSLLCADRDGGESDARAYLNLQARPDASTPYMAILGALGSRRMGREAEAQAFLSEALVNAPPAEWPAPVLRYLARSLPAQAMLEAAADDLQKTEAHAFLGLDLLQSGRLSWALDHLRWSRDHGVGGSSSAELARNVLRRIERPTEAASR